MITVEEILRMTQYKGIEVRGGHSGLSHPVAYASVLEVEHRASWLQQDGFLLAEFSDVDIEAQCQLIRNLKNARCACLAVKIGNNEQGLAQEVLDTAQQCEFSILEIPKEIALVGILVEVMDYVFTKKNMDFFGQVFLKDVIFNSYNDEQFMITRAQLLGMYLDRNYVLAVTLSNQVQGELLAADKVILQQQMQKIRRITAEACCVSSPNIVMDSSISMILMADKKKVLVEAVNKLQGKIAKMKLEREELQLPLEYRIGFGTIGRGLLEIKQSYFNSIRAIQTGLVFKGRQISYSFEDLAVFCTLHEVLYQFAPMMMENIINKIDNQEVLETLITYYECNANIEEAAQILFAHKNTIKYRLQKVKENTGLDVKIHEDSFKLYLAVLAYKASFSKPNHKFTTT